jgi:hypothetical protein
MTADPLAAILAALPEAEREAHRRTWDAADAAMTQRAIDMMTRQAGLRRGSFRAAADHLIGDAVCRGALRSSAPVTEGEG